MKKIIKWALIYLLLIIGLFLILTGYNWYLYKQQLVRGGHAKPTFPYARYTQEELNKMYPQYANENVPTRQTPEETYAKFIAALKRGDVDGAMSQFTNRKKQIYSSSFLKDQQENKLQESISRLERKLILKDQLDTFRGYELEGYGQEYIVEFIKDSNGDWKIDSL